MYKIVFNNAAAIKKMPKRRNHWQNQLRDDFIRAIHRKDYDCADSTELQERFDFISGHRLLSKVTEKDVVRLVSPRYGERIEPAKMWGIPQGHVFFPKLFDKLEQDGYCCIPFRSFYGTRQKTPFSGCYVEFYKLGS